MSDRVSITSEIGVLEKVILHTPGFEVEEMTPKSAEQVLYNDILPLPVIAQDHRELKDLLSLVTKVFETKDLLTDVLQNKEVRSEFLDTICLLIGSVENRRAEFESVSAESLANMVIIGIKEKKDTLTKYLSENIFSLPPLPNLYFMRDSAIVVGDKIVTGSMANKVRAMEAVIMKFIFKYHQNFKSEGFIIDGTKFKDSQKATIEGGDLLVLRDDVLAIGISERTSPQSVDIICERLAKQIDKSTTIFAVVLPKERATIHLDMVFTMVDKNRCVIHHPYVLGKKRLPVVKITIAPNGKKKYENMPNLISGLRTVGINLEPIVCGGNESLYQEREQWLSGTNFFAFAPGKFIGYDCNRRTLDEINKAGFTVRHAREFISGREKISDHEKLVIGIDGAELARGGGGVRCMTMPVKRKSVQW